MLSGSDLLLRMASDLGMLPTQLAKIVRTAPLRYKIFEISKKSGGVREVAQPAREVKAIQRWIVREIGPRLPIHESASAYRHGSSIRKNAEAHVNSRYMLKLDFTNFFPSIVRSDLSAHLERYCSDFLDSSARDVIAHVCCWARYRTPPLRLCIGAPSSPLLSNSLMFEFDARLAAAAKKDEVVYTRYADDITLSSRNRGGIDCYIDIVKDLLAEISYPSLRLNEAKTVLASRAGKRVVTGLVITPDGRLSIGRDRKRLIRAIYHRSLNEELSEEEMQELDGLLAFADSIEPGFSNRLRDSIGS